MTCQHVREEIDISHGPDWSPLSKTSLSAITHHWKDKCSFSSNPVFSPRSLFVTSFPWLSPLLSLPSLPSSSSTTAISTAASNSESGHTVKGEKAGAESTTESDQYIDAHFSSPGLILGAFWELTVIEHGQYSSLSLSSFSHLSIHPAILCRVISIILTLNWGIWGSERWDNMSMVTHLIISKANMHLNATSPMICIPNHW